MKLTTEYNSPKSAQLSSGKAGDENVR